MSFPLALLLLQASTVDPGYPLSVFESLCLRGEVRFARGMVKEVEWNEIPYGFRRAFGEARLVFSDRAGAKRYGLESSLPGFRGGKSLLSSDGNWVAVVEPMRPEGDQRCAVAARVIDRLKLRKFGVVPVSFYDSKKTTIMNMMRQGADAGIYPGAIIRIAEFGRVGALVQAYIMKPAAAEADRISTEKAAKDTGVSRPTGGPSNKEN